ncbi:hypothetical protein POVCU1_039260 [Plasmodium ovale curtisi]|uniref:Uncharacterized protein n=1 Tax=Plasmodium ovale curtisi TaxID=864141 RepID=A0A1A8X093_PLAOA|nr:hypothetical protein POVCU1_039260 [Plasmodium ovale curtisi]
MFDSQRFSRCFPSDKESLEDFAYMRHINGGDMPFSLGKFQLYEVAADVSSDCYTTRERCTKLLDGVFHENFEKDFPSSILKKKKKKGGKLKKWEEKSRLVINYDTINYLIFYYNFVKGTGRGGKEAHTATHLEAKEANASKANVHAINGGRKKKKKKKLTQEESYMLRIKHALYSITIQPLSDDMTIYGMTKRHDHAA